ncbi:acyl-CoA dehydrogenase family protein, partial [Pseudonocardia sp. NPDC049154]|uniref:acyl-CoA dehydrogenase family protein n=1 Tax=Pseudonocardia sp. NPDC049154 TaxID=3155501 RepID=UPI0033C19262
AAVAEAGAAGTVAASWAAPPRTSATPTADGWRVTGEKIFVLDGAHADLLLVSARTADGTAVLLVEGGAVGLVRSPATSLDLTRPQARVTLADCPATLVVAPGAGAEAVRRTRDRGWAFLAAEQGAVVRRLLDDTVAYLGTREQFGRPLAGFQALRHRCADVLVAAEAALSLGREALAVPPEERPLAAATAAAHATTLPAAAWDCLHLHGGIGFTWEHDTHLRVRRAQASVVQFGELAEPWDAVAALTHGEPR